MFIRYILINFFKHFLGQRSIPIIGGNIFSSYKRGAKQHLKKRFIELNRFSIKVTSNYIFITL